MKAGLLISLLLLSILVAYSFYGHSDKQIQAGDSKISAAENKRLKIDRFLADHPGNLKVLVKVPGKSKLLLVKNEDWPDEIEYTYNILKDANGRVILISESPYYDSGDRSLSYKHYFDERGDMFAVVKDEVVFNDSVKGGVVRQQLISYYDTGFVLMDKKTKLMDGNFKPVAGKISDFDFNDEEFTVYKNVTKCFAGYHIDDKLARLIR